METTFYLTPAEESLFNALSEKLQDGWSVEKETLSYEDSSLKRQVRLDLMEIDSGEFEGVIARCAPECSPENLEELVKKVDFTGLSQKDMWEICFALGSDGMTYLIGKLLADAKNDDQLEGICALTYLRHKFLESVQ